MRLAHTESCINDTFYAIDSTFITVVWAKSEEWSTDAQGKHLPISEDLLRLGAADSSLGSGLLRLRCSTWWACLNHPFGLESLQDLL